MFNSPSRAALALLVSCGFLWSQDSGTPNPKKRDKTDRAIAIEALFHGIADYSSERLTITYEDGSGFREDVKVRKGADTIHFRGSEGVGLENYVMAGNTGGFVLFNAVFEDDVAVEFDAHFQLVLPNRPFFRVLLNARDEKGFYASDFGSNLLTFTATHPPLHYRSRVKQYRKHPTQWVTKNRQVRIVMKYRKESEKEMGVLEVSLDGVKTRTLKIDKYRKGKVGFWWNNVKFVIDNVSISGRLDEKWVSKKLEDS